MTLPPSPPKISGKLRRMYPHLLPDEAEVWTRFLVREPEYFSLVQYDVHIGKGAEPDLSWPESIRQMADVNSDLEYGSDANPTRRPRWGVVQYLQMTP